MVFDRIQFLSYYHAKLLKTESWHDFPTTSYHEKNRLNSANNSEKRLKFELFHLLIVFTSQPIFFIVASCWKIIPTLSFHNFCVNFQWRRNDSIVKWTLKDETDYIVAVTQNTCGDKAEFFKL